MKKNSENQKLAFSLIEISVVILIIGMLIAGISQGIDLYQDARLSQPPAPSPKTLVSIEFPT